MNSQDKISEQWKLVPVEPTEEMNKAIYGLLSAYDDGSDITPAFFMKMLINAAPSPPQPIYDEAKERKLFEAAAVKSAEDQGLEVDDMLRSDDGDYLNPNIQLAFWGWLACAQSRAKAWEVGHE